MYLHIGNEKLISRKSIIGIFDMDTATVSPLTKDFLKEKESEGKTVISSDNLPKSFILTDGGDIFFSGISTSSLSGRIKSERLEK